MLGLWDSGTLTRSYLSVDFLCREPVAFVAPRGRGAYREALGGCCNWYLHTVASSVFHFARPPDCASRSSGDVHALPALCAPIMWDKHSTDTLLLTAQVYYIRVCEGCAHILKGVDVLISWCICCKGTIVALPLAAEATLQGRGLLPSSSVC